MKIIDRWSIRLALLGLAFGFLQSYKILTLPNFMIGFGVPFAIVLASIGVLIDFSIIKKKKSGQGAMEGRLLGKWSIRLGLLGLAVGMAQHFLSGEIRLAAMIGFSIPYAIILSGIGLLIDFSINKKKHGA
jgi:hypothetical protein